jgi:UDP-glucose 4-epimerase
MKILVTGGAGFVGSHIAKRLLEGGHDVRVLDNFSSGRSEWVPEGAEFVEDDLCHAIDTGLPDHDLAVHAAAYADLRSNWDDIAQRHRLMEENLDSTWTLLEATDKPIIFLSTASVYGSQIGTVTTHDAKPWTIESPYAATKFACEALVRAYSFKRKTPAWCFRLVNVVGARSTHGVIADFVRMARDNGHIHAADDGKQRKSWVCATDVAEAIFLAVRRDIPPGWHNLTSHERISWWDIVDAMQWPRSKVTFEDRPTGAVGDPHNLSVDASECLFSCAKPIAHGIREALDFHKWPRTEVVT